MVSGELSKETLDSYGTLLAELYLPLFKEQGNWGKSDTEHTNQFLQASSAHVMLFCYSGGCELGVAQFLAFGGMWYCSAQSGQCCCTHNQLLAV